MNFSANYLMTKSVMDHKQKIRDKKPLVDNNQAQLSPEKQLSPLKQISPVKEKMSYFSQLLFKATEINGSEFLDYM